MARQLTSFVLLIVPILILNTLRLIVTPLKEMLEISIELDVILHIIALAIGIVLYRRTRLVKDHEWVRSQAVKSVSGHFKAEEQGVWEKDVQMDSNLSDEAYANLKGQVGSVMGSSSQGGNLEVQDEVEVEMLIDSEHVRRAQARVSGDEQFEDGSVHATIGATRRKSPMDAFLDWIGGMFGSNSQEDRDAIRQQTLSQRSRESPVIAQRPIAPIQPIETDRKRPQPMEMVSMTDDGAQAVVIDEETNVISQPVQVHSTSIEEMAYGISSPIGVAAVSSPGGFAPQPTCKTCGAPNPVGERFCSNCGSDL